MDVAFPEAQDEPPLVHEILILPTIPRDVRRDLGHPIRCVVTPLELANALEEVSPVPEVTVAEDDDLGAHEDDVGSARQVGNVDAIPKTESPKLAA